MVLPYLNSADSSKISDFILPRAHALVIGPGLRLDAEIEKVVTDIIEKVIQRHEIFGPRRMPNRDCLAN